MLTIETRNETVEVDDTTRELPPGDYAVLEVRDTGVGISEEVGGQIFEPFFTTKDRGKGTGLGLAMCYGIVKQSGGYLTFSSEVGQGSVFSVYLQKVAESADPEVAETLRVSMPAGEETILVVEDNALVRATAVELLRAQGYTVLEAAGGADALHLVKEQQQTIHLLVTDVVMPDMNGKEVANRIRSLRPSIRVLYVSGYTADEISHHGVIDPGLAFLQKPYTSQDLVQKVRYILDH